MPDYWYRNEETGEERLFTVPDPPQQRLETTTLPPVRISPHMDSRGDFAAGLRKARETEQRRVWWLVSEEAARREGGG